MSSMPFYGSQKKAEQEKKLCQPKKAFDILGPKLVGDKGKTDMEIEQSGNISALQRHRLVEDGEYIQNYHPKGQDPLISHHLYFIEEDLREVIQEEESIKLDKVKHNSAMMERLEVLNREYWFLEQQWWSYYSCLRQGYQRPGFDLWRSHPKWYMHQTLRNYCASKNGCCARGCGCCYLREPSPKRKLGVGHCTAECDCCCKARGFRVSEEDKRVLKQEFREKSLKCPKHEIIRVALWGIVGDCYENPFDMIQIDEPPSYQENSAKDNFDKIC